MCRGSCDYHMREAVISITYSSDDVRAIPFSGEHLRIVK